METAERRMWRGRIWAAVLAGVLLLPFVHKAFHLDDTLFLFAAEQIARAPMDFYGSDVNWYGTTMRMAGSRSCRMRTHSRPEAPTSLRSTTA